MMIHRYLIVFISGRWEVHDGGERRGVESDGEMKRIKGTIKKKSGKGVVEET